MKSLYRTSFPSLVVHTVDHPLERARSRNVRPQNVRVDRPHCGPSFVCHKRPQAPKCLAGQVTDSRHTNQCYTILHVWWCNLLSCVTIGDKSHILSGTEVQQLRFQLCQSTLQMFIYRLQKVCNTFHYRKAVGFSISCTTAGAV